MNCVRAQIETLPAGESDWKMPNSTRKAFGESAHTIDLD